MAKKVRSEEKELVRVAVRNFYRNAEEANRLIAWLDSVTRPAVYVKKKCPKCGHESMVRKDP